MSYYTVKNDMLQAASKLSPNTLFLEKREDWHRFDTKEQVVVDARAYSDFFIDSAGIKHIAQHDKKWQELQCQFDDELIKENKKWRVKTVDDVLNEKRTSAHHTLKNKHADALRLLTGNVTPENRDTWPEQREAAQAYSSGRASEDQKELLRDSLKQGETLKSLVATILGKVKINRKLTGLANGVLRRAEDALEKGTDPDDVLKTAAEEMEAAKQTFFAAVEAMKQTQAT